MATNIKVKRMVELMSKELDLNISFDRAEEIYNEITEPNFILTDDVPDDVRIIIEWFIIHR